MTSYWSVNRGVLVPAPHEQGGSQDCDDSDTDAESGATRLCLGAGRGRLQPRCEFAHCIIYAS